MFLRLRSPGADSFSFVCFHAIRTSQLSIMGVVLNCISLMSSELMTGAFLARAIVETLTCREGASGPPFVAPYPVCLGANMLSLQ
jgi:hypothetical protein